MDPLEIQMMAQAAEGSDLLGWLMLLIPIIAAVALALTTKMLRVTPTETSESDGVSQNSIDHQLLVVLTAAATTSLGTPIVVRRVTFLDTKTVSGWAEVGRTALHWSHNLPRNP